MSARRLLYCAIGLLGFAITTFGSGVPGGWKMTDRFMGFRYELFPIRTPSDDVNTAIRDKADELFCFGWVQDSPRNSIVGEARCSKSAAMEMRLFLSSLAVKEPFLTSSGTVINETVAFRDYPDTLIRLHFTHFKLLSKWRNTCFRDEPHKCSHLYDETEDGIKFRDR
jgi:hypothetical protein